MPLKRTARIARETPAARALRIAVAEELAAALDRLPGDGLTKAQRARRDAKERRRMDRAMTKARAKWDAASPAWRERQGAKILAGARRYDKAAKLPADGGREIYAVHRYADAERARWEKRSTSAGSFATHRASIERDAAAEAVRPAPALEDAPAADESPEPPKRARRPRPAGLVGYIDPRLIDEDDWED